MAEKLRLDPSLLTPRDLKRAKVVLGGRNPFDLLADPVEAVTLTVWCLRSRQDSEFTWDQAEDTPLGEFDMGGDMGGDMGAAEESAEPSPPTAELKPSGLEFGSNGTSTASDGGNASNRKQRSATSST